MILRSLQTTTGSRVYAFSIFITWCAKVVILRIGGISLYNKARPYFFGLVIGYLASIGISSIVDYIWFPGDGHSNHGW